MSQMHDICEIKERLIEWTKTAIDLDPDAIDAHELGEVVDMIKDCYQLEECYWKSEYYKMLVDESDTQTYNDRRGYNPDVTPKAMIHRGLTRFHNPSTIYDRYEEARRHYTTTRSIEDKNDMDMYANQHMSETITSMKDIWRNADPDMKERMKREVNALISSMT